MILAICWMELVVGGGGVGVAGRQLRCPGAKPNSGELQESLRPNTPLILPPPAGRIAGSAAGAQGPSKIAPGRGQRSNLQRDLGALSSSRHSRGERRPWESGSESPARGRRAARTQTRESCQRPARLEEGTSAETHMSCFLYSLSFERKKEERKKGHSVNSRFTAETQTLHFSYPWKSRLHLLFKYSLTKLKSHVGLIFFFF